MIKEAYCSFEVSNLLREKGFDGLCHSFWYVGKNILECKCVSRPTHQVAMAWLRSKGIYISVFIDDESEMPWTYNVYKELRDGTTECVYHHHGHYYPLEDGYEEAVEAALKYSLENLI